jgi:hypothetical protein
MHPHPEDAYVQMFNRAKTRRIAGQLHGDRFAALASLAREPDRHGFRTGRLSTYVDIDPDRPWLDTETNDLADEGKVRAIVLPKNLKPQYEAVEFLFHAEKHFLFIANPRFSPSSFARALTNILNTASVNKSDGAVTVTAVQEHETLDLIFGIRRLGFLEITVTRPNGDSLKPAGERVRERMKAANALRMTERYYGDRKKGLVVDQDMRDAAEVALENGEVNARGWDAEGTLVKESTANHPMEHRTKYDPGEESEAVAFRREVRPFLARLLERIFG